MELQRITESFFLQMHIRTANENPTVTAALYPGMHVTKNDGLIDFEGEC